VLVGRTADEFADQPYSACFASRVFDGARRCAEAVAQP
jgi:hypothetical protein